MNEAATESEPKRRWYQYSLRSLLIFMLVTGVFLGWLGKMILDARKREAALVEEMAAMTLSKLPELHGKYEVEIIKTLGKPLSTYNFTMPVQRRFRGYRSGLHSTYPIGNTANANVSIKELVWKDGEYIVTVWLHQQNKNWSVFDTLRRHEDLIID